MVVAHCGGEPAPSTGTADAAMTTRASPGTTVARVRAGKTWIFLLFFSVAPGHYYREKYKLRAATRRAMCRARVLPARVALTPGPPYPFVRVNLCACTAGAWTAGGDGTERGSGRKKGGTD